MVAAGRLLRPHGLAGGIKVLSFSGEVAHFPRLDTVEVRHDDRRIDLVVADVALHAATPVLRFVGITSRDAVRRYTGWELWVPNDRAAPLADGEVYLRDLVGLRVRCEERDVGRIVGYYDGSQSALLEVESAGRRHLVPYLAHYWGAVDSAAGTIRLHHPWMLE